PGTSLATLQSWDDVQREEARGRGERMRQGPVGERVELVTLYVPDQRGMGGMINSVLLSIPGYGVLRNPETGDLLSSPLLRSVVAMILLFFVVPGTVYGWTLGNMRTDRDIIDAMADAMSSM